MVFGEEKGTTVNLTVSFSLTSIQCELRVSSTEGLYAIALDSCGIRKDASNKGMCRQANVQTMNAQTLTRNFQMLS